MGSILEGKVAVVTGGSRGIGEAVARRLAGEGCDCLLAARTADDLRATAERLAHESGRQIVICPIDLRTLPGCEALVGKAKEVFGGVDILVNSAGNTQGGPFLEQPDDLWLDGFALKFYACVRLSRLFWPQLKKRRGTVINIVGGFARTPDPDFMIGGAVNAAVANFSKALAGLGLRDDVNVNAIHPGITLTRRAEEIFAQRARQAGTTPAAYKRASAAEQGLRRFGRPEDVAHLVAFLCSPQARHIQGTAIAVDGGATHGLY